MKTISSFGILDVLNSSDTIIIVMLVAIDRRFWDDELTDRKVGLTYTKSPIRM